MHRLKQLLKTVLLSCILFFITGCTLATKFEIYELWPNNGSPVSLTKDDIEVRLYLYPTETRQLILPLIYQKSKYNTPFRLVIHVDGNFEEIEPVMANCVINVNEKPLNYLITRTDFKKKVKNNRTMFRINPDKYQLDFPGEQIEFVEFEFEFYVVNGKKRKKYRATNTFYPKVKKYITNDAMSI